jgi:hypothetical protein
VVREFRSYLVVAVDDLQKQFLIPEVTHQNKQGNSISETHQELSVATIQLQVIQTHPITGKKHLFPTKGAASIKQGGQKHITNNNQTWQLIV